MNQLVYLCSLVKNQLAEPRTIEPVVVDPSVIDRFEAPRDANYFAERTLGPNESRNKMAVLPPFSSDFKVVSFGRRGKMGK